MNKDTSYYAYKNLLASLAKDNFYSFKKLLGDLDYHSFKENNELLLNVLDVIKENNRYNDSADVLLNFYKINPEEKNNIPLAKKILERVSSENDVEKIFNLLGEDNFIKDYPLIKKIIQNTEGRFFTRGVSEKAPKDESLREFLYELDNFSLTWFKLDAPKDKELIISILQKDYNSYRKLSDDQRCDKEITLTALYSLSEGIKKDSYSGVISTFYSYIPMELKKDENVCLLLSKMGFVEQIPEAYMHKDVLVNVLNANYSNKSQDKATLYRMESLPKESFKNYKNIKVFLDFLNENNSKFRKDHDNYAAVYKMIKSMAKHNKYVKELFSKSNSVWNRGNIGETKGNSSSFFYDFFNKNIPQMSEEISYYIAAEDMKVALSQKNPTTNQKKIKI